MGNKNEAIFLKKLVPVSPGRILEVGSRDVGSSQGFREHYGQPYTGVDVEAGRGVDIVHDVCQNSNPFPHRYDLVICCSVLEHMKNPWLAASVMQNLVEPGGMLYVTAPWVWRYHAYPDDYWRFSWRGLQQLFNGLLPIDVQLSTNKEGDFLPAMVGSDHDQLIVANGRKYLPYLQVHWLFRKPL